MSRSINLSEHVRPILAAIQSVPIPAKFGQEAPEPIVPFVTISREVGVGAWTLAQQLADALNRDEGGEKAWTCWDRELVEKVAADFRLSQHLVESLEETAHSWLTDFFESLNLADDPSEATEMTVLKKVAQTVRALAQAGRVILVGRGGFLLTRKMPGGVHVRLDAPLEYRIVHMMRHLNVPREKAAQEVRELSRCRAAFFKRYWPNEVISPDLFTVTLNTAIVSQETCVKIIMDLVEDVIARQTRVPATPPVAEMSARR